MYDPIEILIVLIAYFLFDPNGKYALLLTFSIICLIFSLFFYFSSDSDSDSLEE